MGSIVYITEFKEVYQKQLPESWKIYHFSPNCISLIKNSKRSSLNIVEKDDEELEKQGYRFCSNCIEEGIRRGFFIESPENETYYPDDEDIRLMKQQDESYIPDDEDLRLMRESKKE